MGILTHSEVYHGLILQLWLGHTQHRVRVLSRSLDGEHTGKIKTVKGNTPDEALTKARHWVDENGKQYYGHRE
jgi:hypothetical protein